MALCPPKSALSLAKKLDRTNSRVCVASHRESNKQQMQFRLHNLTLTLPNKEAAVWRGQLD